jgi:hypothetical protein
VASCNSVNEDGNEHRQRADRADLGLCLRHEHEVLVTAVFFGVAQSV